MSCEHYKDALIEAAASGAAPSGELRAHLAACASCREVFVDEQSLFAAIDSGLRAAANVKVPPSLLPRVRVSLDEVVAAPQLRWVQPLVFASAIVALVFAIFLMARPRHATPENVAKQDPVAAPATAKPKTNANPEKSPPAGTQIASMRAIHSHPSRNSTNIHSAASSNPEVLVPPDEREAFARLVAVLNQHSDVASSLLANAPQKDAPGTGDPPKIPDIEIKLLDGTAAEASDGASEKH